MTIGVIKFDRVIMLRRCVHFAPIFLQSIYMCIMYEARDWFAEMLKFLSDFLVLTDKQQRSCEQFTAL